MSRRKSTRTSASESTPIALAEAGLPAPQAALLYLLRALDTAEAAARALVEALDGFQPEDKCEAGFDEDAAGVLWALRTALSQLEQYQRGDTSMIRMFEANDGFAATAELVLARKLGVPLTAELRAAAWREHQEQCGHTPASSNAPA